MAYSTYRPMLFHYFKPCLLLAFLTLFPFHSSLASDHEQWDGVYLGGFIGGSNSTFAGGPGYERPTGDDSGLTGGGNLGANWELSPFVLSADAAFALLDNRYRGTAIKFSENSTTTLRARVGYPMGIFLPFASGGVAFTDLLTKVYASGSEHRVATGFTAGGGLDIHLPYNCFARVEYLYIDVPEDRTGVDNVSIRGGSSINTVRVGLNYIF